VLARREVTGSGVAELAPTGALPAGVYLIRLAQAGRFVTARVVIL
jgi:hypothetical protein